MIRIIGGISKADIIITVRLAPASDAMRAIILAATV
jgi:hypothetical protein